MLRRFAGHPSVKADTGRGPEAYTVTAPNGTRYRVLQTQSYRWSVYTTPDLNYAFELGRPVMNHADPDAAIAAILD